MSSNGKSLIISRSPANISEFNPSLITWANVFGYNKGDSTPSYVDAGVIKICNDISEISALTGINAGTLEKTINTYNEYAANRYDPEFHRGEALRVYPSTTTDVSAPEDSLPNNANRQYLPMNSSRLNHHTMS
jgi:hypothetical protein